jgi:hypothetical protein
MMLEALEKAVMTMRERYPAFATMSYREAALSPSPAFPEDLPATTVDRPGDHGRSGGYTEELLSADLMLEDPSMTPTSSRSIPLKAGSSDSAWTDAPRLGGPTAPAPPLDDPTAEVLAPTRRSPAPSPPLPASMLPSSNSVEAKPSSSAVPSFLEDGPPWPEADQAELRDGSKGRSLVLGLSIGAMAISLVILIVVVLLTRTGPSPQAAPTTVELPDDTSGSPSKTDLGALVPNAKTTTQDAGVTRDAASQMVNSSSPTEADAAADTGVGNEPPEAGIATKQTQARPRIRPKRPTKRHKIRRGTKTPSFDTAIPFDKLGQQAGSSANDESR